MALAVIAFDFDPALRLGNLVVSRQTVAIAAVVLIAVSLAAFLAHRRRRRQSQGRRPGPGSPPAIEQSSRDLRREDLLMILLAVVPGSVYAARIGYVLIHLDYYGAHPGAWLDFSQGSLELGFGLVGGATAGVAMAMAIGAPVGRWLHVWALPVVVGLGLGKFAMALGGAGQGIAADVPWATAYLGPGPWGSVLPDVPAHPAQIYEGLLDLAVAGLIGALLIVGRFRRPDGSAFLAAISLWGLARVEVAFVWRDPEVLGPFRSAQVVALVIAATSLGLFLRRSAAAQRRTDTGLAERTEPVPPRLVVGVVTGNVGVSGAPAAAIAGGFGVVPDLAGAAPRDTALPPALEPSLRPPRRVPETRMPDRSGWLTAVRPTVESARSAARPTVPKVEAPATARESAPAGFMRPARPNQAAARTTNEAIDVSSASATVPAAEAALAAPHQQPAGGAIDAPPAAPPRPTATPTAAPPAAPPRPTATPTDAPPAALRASPGGRPPASEASPAPPGPEPPPRVREPFDLARRRQPDIAVPGRSGWLTAVPTRSDEPARPTPPGGEPRTSESSSSSSS